MGQTVISQYNTAAEHGEAIKSISLYLCSKPTCFQRQKMLKLILLASRSLLAAWSVKSIIKRRSNPIPVTLHGSKTRQTCKSHIITASDEDTIVDILAKNMPLTSPFLDKFLLPSVLDTWMTPRLFTLEYLAHSRLPLSEIMSLG